MKCYLHIGMMKTGSTTLQEFLHLNQESLQKIGYSIDKYSGRKGHDRLMLSCLNPSTRGYITTIKGIEKDQDLINLQNIYIDKYRKYISKCKTPYFIFSCELIYHWLASYQEVLRLREIIQSFGMQEIKVLIYLREQSSYTNSYYSESSKWGHLESEPPLPNPQSSELNYQLSLELWSAVFGKDNLVVRIFSPEDLKNGSIVHDFLDCVNADAFVDCFKFPDNTNKSLSHTSIEILRRMNSRIPLVINGKINPISREYVKYMIKNDRNGNYVMPKQLAEQYRNVYANSNKWVQEHYFPQRKSLFKQEPIPEPTQGKIPEDQLDFIAEVISDLWIDIHAHPFKIARNQFKLILLRHKYFRKIIVFYQKLESFLS